MQSSCTVCMISVTLTFPYLWFQGVYTNPVLWDCHLWNVCDGSCMWLCKCTNYLQSFLPCHPIAMLKWIFDFWYLNSDFTSDQIREYSSYGRRQQNFQFLENVCRFSIYYSATRNWTQDFWLETPVLYHWAVTINPLHSSIMLPHSSTALLRRDS